MGTLRLSDHFRNCTMRIVSMLIMLGLGLAFGQPGRGQGGGGYPVERQRRSPHGNQRGLSVKIDDTPDGPNGRFPPQQQPAGPNGGFPPQQQPAGPNGGFFPPQQPAGPNGGGFFPPQQPGGPNNGFPPQQWPAGPPPRFGPNNGGFLPPQQPAGPNNGFPPQQQPAGPNNGFGQQQPDYYCVDKNPKCSLWANNGWCGKGSRYMLNRCKKSCNLCQGGYNGEISAPKTGTSQGGLMQRLKDMLKGKSYIDMAVMMDVTKDGKVTRDEFKHFVAGLVGQNYLNGFENSLIDKLWNKLGGNGDSGNSGGIPANEAFQPAAPPVRYGTWNGQNGFNSGFQQA